MIYYIILFAYMVLVQYITRNTKSNDGRIMVVTFLPLFLYGALRVHCGDYEIYEQYNTWVRSSGDHIYDVIERMEPGYALLNKFFSYRWIIIISSLLACFAYGMLFLKVVPKEYRWFGMIVFFLVGDKTFYFMFVSIRNSIAISLLIIYVVYRITSEKKGLLTIKEILIFLLVTSLAYSIHASAIMYFPIAFIMTLRRNVNTLEIYLWIALLIVLWVVPAEQIIGTGVFSSNEYFERYDEYVEGAQNAGRLAKLGATIFALLCLADIRLNRQERNSFISRLALIFVYSYLIGGLNGRMCQYFVPFLMVFMVGVYSDKNKSDVTLALLVFALAFLFYSSFIAGTFGNAIYSPFINYKVSLSSIF